MDDEFDNSEELDPLRHFDWFIDSKFSDIVLTILVTIERGVWVFVYLLACEMRRFVEGAARFFSKRIEGNTELLVILRRRKPMDDPLLH
jgi:hypothetical protein